VLRISLFPTGIIVLLILELFITPGYSQSTTPSSSNEFMAVYAAAKEKFGTDPLLMNGIYYENPYYNALGHPFLGDGEFYQGSVVFRNKRYEGVSLKYDIFHQQLIIEQSREDARKSVLIGDIRYEGVSISYDENQQMIIKQEVGKPSIMNLLANEFVSEFSVDGMDFRKILFDDDVPSFYQVLSENSNVSCYYYWQKIRYKSQDEGDRSIFVFTTQKLRSYLFINDELLRYRNNRSFLKLFSGEAKSQIRTYMRSCKIKVNDAESFVIKDLVEYCEQTVSKKKM
jgi:hypothetical protein